MPRCSLPFFFLLLATTSHAQQYLGVRTWGGTDSDQLNALALDPQQRVYALGGFWSTADMDPGLGSAYHTAVGVQDIFLSRFTAEGQWEWSAQLGGTGHDHAQALAVDSDGVFVGGEFRDTLVSPAFPGDTVAVVSNGADDALLARYSLDGNLLWVITAGGAGSDHINDVAVDAAGNVLAIGYFQGSVDFDPGPAVVHAGADIGDAMFLWKVSAAGELVWVRSWAGSSSENGLAVAVGPADDLWVGGGYYGTMDLDPNGGGTTVSAPGFEQNAFLVHLDAEGDFLFGGDMGGYGSDALADLRTDAQGGVFAIGGLTDIGDFDPGAGTITLPHVGGPDGFVLKVSPTGDLVHAAMLASAGYDQPRALELGPNGSILVTGGFDGVIDLDPGPGTANHLGNGVSDVYVVLLDSALNHVESTVWGGSGSEEGTCLGWSGTGRRYVGGLFEYTVDFDPGPGVDEAAAISFSRDAFLSLLCSVVSVEQPVTIAEGDSLIAGGAWQTESGTFTDNYTAQSGCDSVVVTLLTVETSTGTEARSRTIGLLVFPNPAHELLSIRSNGCARGQWLELRDAVGRLVRQEWLASSTDHTFSVSTLAPGKYVARLSGARAVFLKH